MDPRHSIRLAREPDVTALAAIERAAARLLEGMRRSRAEQDHHREVLEAGETE